jgi:hypothetical protein
MVKPLDPVAVTTLLARLESTRREDRRGSEHAPA